MYLFDIKSKDKKKKNSTIINKTLDNKHNEMVIYFKKLQESLPEKYKEQKDLEKEYQDIIKYLNDSKNIDTSENVEQAKNKNEFFLKKKNLEYKIQEKQVEIERIENKYEEKEYYIKVGDILFDYYNIFENNEQDSPSKKSPENSQENNSDKEDDSSDEDDNSDFTNDMSDDSDTNDTENTNDDLNDSFTTSKKKNNTTTTNTKKKNETYQNISVSDYFSNMPSYSSFSLSNNSKLDQKQFDDDSFVQKDIMSFFEVKKSDGNNPCVYENKNTQKSVLHNKYMQEIQKYYNPELKKTNLTICPECGIERIMMVTEGILVCQECCFMDKVIVDSERPSFKEPPPEISYFAYKRINHFNEWLNQFQAKESSEIPPDVFDHIILELKKEKNLNLRNLKKSRVREILSKLKLNRYYEHVSHIIYKINGIPPPSIPNDLEEILRNMFRTIQGPFMKVCPEIAKKRKNFLSYSYVLYKFLELLGYDELKKQFPLLKCREKLHRQDKIWQGICKELGWQFIRSI